MADCAFIEPAWLEATRAKAFFYPAAGRDWAEPLRLFGEHIDEFWFVDIAYPRGLSMEPVYKGDADYQLVSRTIVGDPAAAIEYRRDEFGREYRYLLPSILREVYQRADHTRCIAINRRRGFGQYALVNEFSDHAIGVFMHRGDSPGEAGSNVYFLANKNSRHEPCGRLFDKLSRKLDDKVLVITDGSNTGLKRLKAFHQQDITGPAAYSAVAKLGFVYGGFSWQCVGYMSNRYGPTLIWGLSRQR